MRIKSTLKLPMSGSRFTQVLLLAMMTLYSVSTTAQCAMCRAALESEGDVAKGEAVNDGIVYLMVIPYLIVIGVGFAIYKIRQQKVT